MIPGVVTAAERVSDGAVLAALAAGATIVTPNRRLARRLETLHACAQSGSSWTTPDVLPWHAWVLRSWRELRDSGRVADARPCLDEAQARRLWEEALRDHPAAGGLLYADAAAARCQEAWQLAQDWRLEPQLLHTRASADGRVFLELAGAWQARVQASGFVDPATLPARLGDAAGRLSVASAWWHGFDRLSPVQERLRAALGPRARRTAPEQVGGMPAVLACADQGTELEAAVAWARDRLARNPDASVGIVVPDLAACAETMVELLDEALSPQRLLPDGRERPRPWNLSLGTPLAEAPAVAIALRLLALACGPIGLADAGRVLRAPHVGGAEAEAAARAALDGVLRGRGRDPLDAEFLLSIATRGGVPHACPELARRLAGARDALHGPRPHRAPSAWAEAFARALRAFGWPGDASLDSETYQLSAAWSELLEQLARLDAVTGRWSRAEALGTLQRSAGRSVFQPESGAAPVQVLGLLEASGQRFDAAWVVGLHDEVLPAPLRPSPFLPVGLQRERRMPRACPDTELALARARIAELAALAPELVFSWPRAREDEPLRPSPLLAPFPAVPGRPQGVATLAELGFAARREERLDDTLAPPLTGIARGGTGLLQSYSACPFQAFAAYRLDAAPLEPVAPGVTGLARGLFLHATLDRFWKDLRGRAALAALTPAERAAKLRDALASSMHHLADQPPGQQALEREQSLRVLDRLLDLELERSDFEVERREARLELQAGPLTLRGKVDRVDRVPGGRAVIDYKTGSAGPSEWVGARPRSPQLPLYALGIADVVAVAFACLKPGATGFRGLARDRDAMRIVGPRRGHDDEATWAGLLDGWRTALDVLATSLAAGDARVAPRQARVCESCGFNLICRREELARAGMLGHG